MVLAMLQKIEKYLSINLEVLLLYIKNLIKFINIKFKFKYLIMTFYWDVYTPYLKTLKLSYVSFIYIVYKYPIWFSSF